MPSAPDPRPPAPRDDAEIQFDVWVGTKARGSTHAVPIFAAGYAAGWIARGLLNR